MRVRNICHEGKTVFVGIDVHKKTYVINARGEHMASPLKMSNLEADPVKLAKKLQQLFPGGAIKSVYESGFCGFVLHRELIKHGIDNIVVNPASIVVAANDKVKTDPRDADKMSLHRSLGLLTGIRIPSVEEELARLYSRSRRQLVNHRTAVGNQIKSKLMQFGFIKSDDDRPICNKRVEEFEALPLPVELAVTIKSLGQVYRSLNAEIKKLEDKLCEQAEADDELEMVYRSVPGVGPISARILATELGNMSQFHSQKALYAFVGLTPSEYSSGEMERKGHITRHGRAELRAVLVEVSWRAIDKDPALMEVYNNIKVTRGGKRAIVAVARRLIGRMRACFQHETLYKTSYGMLQTEKLPRGKNTRNKAQHCSRLVTPASAAEVHS